MRLFGCSLIACFSVWGSTVFWAPLNPSRANYSITVRIDPAGGRLEGSEAIRFRNATARPIGRVAFLFVGDQLRLRGAERVPGVKSPALFELAKSVAPGETAELVVEWAISQRPLKDGEGGATSDWYPRLYWGFGTLDDYEVKAQVPAGFTFAATGKLENGIYRAPGVLACGIFVGKGFQVASQDAGGVAVTAIFTAKGERCARLLLKTAVDAIGYYRGRFGFYPHNSLTIVPGDDDPKGGYPVATGMVFVHGQERMAERPDDFWKWITAHEIGHMYWSNYVLAQGADTLDWLMIGLGIHADREYRRARGITNVGELRQTYAEGVEKGYDTTMDVTDEQGRAIQWDFNNVVEHGKSSAALDALESVIGAKTFDAAYRRCLHQYGGKRMGWRDFQRVAEEESGQDLGWFFEQWVRSGVAANYKVAAQSCSGDDCTVRIARAGTMRMPVTVAARFEDGTEQRAVTERLADEEVLHFRSKARLKEVVIEPDKAVVMAATPTPKDKDLLSQIEAQPYTGAGDESLSLYRNARDAGLQGDGPWLKLAWALYDGRHYPEALDAFKRLEKSDEAMWKFVSLVWQGHVLDLLGQRAEAIAEYQAALRLPGSPQVRHDQYHMKIDKQWVEERLKTPFTR